MLIDTVELQKQIDKKLNARYRRIDKDTSEGKRSLRLLDSAYKAYAEIIEEIEDMERTFGTLEVIKPI